MIPNQARVSQTPEEREGPRSELEPFASVLYAAPAVAAAPADCADLFADLNLDQILAALTAGREEYRLEEFFCAPLRGEDSVRYRHAVLRDLEHRDVLDAVTKFVRAMSRVRVQEACASDSHYGLEKQRWFLEATWTYCSAVSALAASLDELALSSDGLLGLRSYLTSYGRSDRFSAVAQEAASLRDELGAICYSILIRGAKVTVNRFESQPDYAADVERTFARFRRTEADSRLSSLRGQVRMDHVEAWIAERVARLFPDIFRDLARFCDLNRSYIDASVARFDREVRFYLAYLDLMASVRAQGLSFCLPEVSEQTTAVCADETFDLALALKMITSEAQMVVNDLRLEMPERIAVVSGPNNGGKTTFARAFGQLHYLASLGLPVAGTRVRLQLPDRVYSHFEREERIESLRGKLEDELVRLHAILEQATDRSVIIMNETFNSTALDDARLLGTEVIRRVTEAKAWAVYVTFIDELASLNEATVSMVSTIEPDSPARRTFRILRRPADGLAYAAAIADKYRLTYDQLLARIRS